MMCPSRLQDLCLEPETGSYDNESGQQISLTLTKKQQLNIFFLFSLLSILTAENPLLVNGGSPNVHLMQPHIVLNPQQTFSPVKTRRMRQSLSNSEPQLKAKQEVPNINQGWPFKLASLHVLFS